MQAAYQKRQALTNSGQVFFKLLKFRLEYKNGTWILMDGDGLKHSTNGTWYLVKQPYLVHNRLTMKAGNVLLKAIIISNKSGI